MRSSILSVGWGLWTYLTLICGTTSMSAWTKMMRRLRLRMPR